MESERVRARTVGLAGTDRQCNRERYRLLPSERSTCHPFHERRLGTILLGAGS